jgi:hypothetical protein
MHGILKPITYDARQKDDDLILGVLPEKASSLYALLSHPDLGSTEITDDYLAKASLRSSLGLTASTHRHCFRCPIGHLLVMMQGCCLPILMPRWQAWPKAQHRAHGCEQTHPGSIAPRGGARHDLEEHACFLNFLRAAHSVL